MWLTVLAGEDEGPALITAAVEILQVLEAPFEFEFCRSSDSQGLRRSLERSGLLLHGPANGPFPPNIKSFGIYAGDPQSETTLIKILLDLLIEIHEPLKAERLSRALAQIPVPFSQDVKNLGGKGHTLMFTKALIQKLNA